MVPTLLSFPFSTKGIGSIRFSPWQFFHQCVFGLAPSNNLFIANRYIAPEQVPVQYGGLSREGEQEFATVDAATEITVKPAAKHIIEFPADEVFHHN